MVGLAYIFAVLTTEELVIHLHNIWVYVPIFLFIGALIADIFNYYGRKHAFSFGNWLVILGWIACIPAIMTGLTAMQGYDLNDYFVSQHRYLGYATGVSASLYAGLRISAMIWKLPLKPVHYVVLSALMVALISWASDYGFLIRSLV
jgi:uncharacterized membrane protein